MIRSAAHVWFEAAMERGARDAELRALAELFKPMTDAVRKMGIRFADACRRMSEALEALERAKVRTGRT